MLPDEIIARDVIDYLDDEGITAHWDYPGYISVRVPGPIERRMAYGRDGDAWYGEVTSESAPWECSEIDEVRPDEWRGAVACRIAAVLIAAYLREATPHPARFPLTHALVGAFDGVES